MRERLHDVPAIEPEGYRVGWSPDAHRIVIQFGNPESPLTIGLTVEMAARLADALRSEAHLRRSNVGRPDA